MLRIGCQRPGDNLISRRIAEFDEPFKYSHAALIFGADMVCEAHARDGVRFHRYVPDPARWDFWLVKATAEQEQSIREFCEVEAGDGYDFDGVFRFKLGIFKQDEEKWFCSELVLAAVQHGWGIKEVDPWLTSPNALSVILGKTPNAELVAVTTVAVVGNVQQDTT